MNTEHLFSDDPVDGYGDAPDLLGRLDYAQHVVALRDGRLSLLDHLGQRGEPVTVDAARFQVLDWAVRRAEGVGRGWLR